MFRQCPDIVCFPATVLASADLFPLILSDENTKVLHTAVKMDNVKNLSGGTLGLENVFTKMCGSTQAADSSRLAISSYLDTFFNQNCISVRKKKRCRSPLELCWRLFPLFFNKCVFLGVWGGYMLIYFAFNSVCEKWKRRMLQNNRIYSIPISDTKSTILGRDWSLS